MDPLNIRSSLHPVRRFSKLGASIQEVSRSKLSEKTQTSRNKTNSVRSLLPPCCIWAKTIVFCRAHTCRREDCQQKGDTCSLEAGIQLLREKSLPQLCVRQGWEPGEPLRLLLHWAVCSTSHVKVVRHRQGIPPAIECCRPSEQRQRASPYQIGKSELWINVKPEAILHYYTF